MHSENLFLTLTYGPVNLPEDEAVNPRDLQLFIKRLRQNVLPTQFRYFAVGEYGDKTMRPHYHLALFGLGASHEEAIRKAWPLGHIMIGTFTTASASYIGGYVTKKMTKKDDPRLNGRHPEFTRMSNRPGIGAPAMDTILDLLTSKSGSYLLADGDVPKALRHGDKIYPLGRYLRSKLREGYGFKDEYVEKLKEIPKQELQAMLSDFFASKTREEHRELRSQLSSHFPKARSSIELTWDNLQMERNIKSRLNLKQRKL